MLGFVENKEEVNESYPISPKICDWPWSLGRLCTSTIKETNSHPSIDVELLNTPLHALAST